MTDHTPEPQVSDSTISEGGAARGRTEDLERGVLGGSADRMDSPGEGSGGMPAAGADGSTAAREDLRVDLGERSEEAGREDADALGQGQLEATDDRAGGSIT